MPPLTRRTFLATPAAATAAAQINLPGRNLLSQTYPLTKLSTLLLPRTNWCPFPPATDRDGWLTIPTEVRQNIIRNGASELSTPWPIIPASYFLDYTRTGNRQKADSIRGDRRDKLASLVLAECCEGRSRFLDAILDGIWTTCEETYWGSTAHLSLQKAGHGLPDAAEPTVDLFAADTAALLAWTGYLLGKELDDLSPLIRPRIWLEVNRRVLTPCETRDDFWWMGTAPGGPGRVLNNWTPWVDSNWLTANLLLEPDEDRRRRATHKVLRSLDAFLAGYHDDGGCDEGPSYWNRAGGSLFDNLELLHSASDGKIDVYADPLIGEIGRYIVRAHIHDDYFTNFADASAKVRIDGDLVYRYGRCIGDRDMQALGAWAARGKMTPLGTLGRALPALFDIEIMRSAEARQPLLRDVWLPGIQMMAARSQGGSPEGLYVAAHGGHNAESHNHNDVGDFVIYVNGQPAIIDIGVETYTAKTFSSRRYEIWTMQSAWHNLPTIDGHMQAAGRDFRAKDVSHHADNDKAEFALDIAAAYPQEAGIKTWKRKLTLNRRDQQLTLTDSYTLTRQPQEITQTLITPCTVEVAPGKLTLRGSHLQLEAKFDPNLFDAAVEEVKVKDRRLQSSWGNRLYRIQLTANTPPTEATWTLTFYS